MVTLYYMGTYMSIDGLNKYVPIYLADLYMDTYRHMGYNIAILGKGAPIRGAPGRSEYNGSK